MPLEHVRLSMKARDQLITLKRRTGIANWNVLCRWALCASLAEKTPVPDAKVPFDSNIEMTWRTFAGELGDTYWALVQVRCIRDGLDAKNESVVANQFRLHLHRGISYLAGNKDVKGIADLIRYAPRSTSMAVA